MKINGKGRIKPLTILFFFFIFTDLAIYSRIEKNLNVDPEVFSSFFKRLIRPKVFETKRIIVYLPSKVLPTNPEIWQKELKKIEPVISSKGGKIIRSYPDYAFSAVEAPAHTYKSLSYSLTKMGYRVMESEAGKVGLNESIKVMHGPYIRFDNSQFTGVGRIIGIIDHGIDCSHPDINDCNPDGLGKILDWLILVGNKAQMMDLEGHGTLIASVAAGTGYSSSGKFKGVAPHASLYIVKAIYLDEVAYGFNWLVKRDIKPDVIVLSYQWDATKERCDGTTNESPYKMLYDAIVNSVEAGIPVVTIAGNTGPSLGTITFPGCIAEVITVGASTKEDKVADFSGRGPPPQDWILKPNIVAPGVNICAARALTTELRRRYGEETCYDSYYGIASGTSFAASHIAGLIALMKEVKPDATVEEIKRGIYFKADDLGEDDYAQGSGRANIIEAINSFCQCYGSCGNKNFSCDPETLKCVRCLPNGLETLVPDPGFEDDVGWGYYSYSGYKNCKSYRSNADSYKGSWSAKLENVNCSENILGYGLELLEIFFKVKGSENFSLTFSYRFISGENNPRAGKVLIILTDETKIIKKIPKDFSKFDNKWNHHTLFLSSPPNTRFIVIYFGVREGYEAFIDEIHFTSLSEGQSCEADGTENSHCGADPRCDEVRPGFQGNCPSGYYCDNSCQCVKDLRGGSSPPPLGSLT